MKITFLPENRQISAPAGQSLLQAAEAAGILLDANCGGAGTCGKCKVRLTAAQAGPLTLAERELLTPGEQAQGYRLACRLLLPDDPLAQWQVLIPGAGGSGPQKSMGRLPEDFSPRPELSCRCQKVAKATMSQQLNDLERISRTFDRPGLTPAPGLLPLVHPALESQRGLVTAVFQGEELLHLEAGDSSDSCFGLAFDIGTTTVVGLLWNLSQGVLADTEARTNYQSLYGADVISRIQFCMQEEGHLQLLQAKIRQCCNDIAAALYARQGLAPERVYAVSVVGNTTMSHLFLGVPPHSLARTPFAPVFCSAQQARGAELGLLVNPRAWVRLLPNIAGHVGSDIVAMALAARLDRRPGCHIAIDIGTNGEIVAVKDGCLLTCSTAAGPAFEGASIHQGMRAAAGAIEGVRISAAGVEIKTIDCRPAIGICGSGLIDAVAQLLQAGVILPQGRMLTREEALQAGLSPALAERLREEDGRPAFILAPRPGDVDILLTQQDVREVQLAKGAIRAGVMTLMRMLELSVPEIDSILLAGAFGSYISRDSALAIGLLPPVPLELVRSIGNAAGTGASLALLSAQERERGAELARRTRHVELSMNQDFQDCYIEAMSFQEKSYEC